MADDLDDEWWMTQTIQSKQHTSDIDEVEDDEEEDRVPEKKIKTDSVSEEEEESQQTVDVSEIQKKKKKKKRRRITEELQDQPSKCAMSTNIVSLIRKHWKSKLTGVEWDEVKLDPDSHFFVSSMSSEGPATYLSLILPKWKRLVKKEDLPCGSPLLLIITASALRAANLNRLVKDFKSDDCKTAKLFAKHIKLGDQTKMLNKQVVHLGIGTPNRIQALLQNGCLRCDHLRAVVLDYNWRDVKYKRIVDIPEIVNDLMCLMKTFLVPRIKSSSCKLGVM